MTVKQDTGVLTVTAPARLHLGFLDLNGSLGRRYGSIGLAIDDPATTIAIRRAANFAASGPQSQRVLAAMRTFADAFGLERAYEAEVASAIPAHAGLGSGTQLTLAIASALARLEGLSFDPESVGALGGRGARSAIGMAAFASGGFVIDGGRGDRERPPPVLVRCDFPASWRALLILDPSAQGVHGDRESKAFAQLPPLPEQTSGHLCRLVLMRLLPALKEADIGPFGAALSEIQALVGAHFAVAQGGSPWTSPAVGRLAKRMEALGATGIGQTSWGPTGFAFVPTEADAAALYHSLVGDARAEGLEMRIVRGRNAGARLTVSS